MVNKYQERCQRMVQRWSGVEKTPNRTSTDYQVEQHTPSCHYQIKSEQVLQSPRAIPVQTSCDVLVVGGGPAGIAAALAAKRAGSDTVLLERFDCFGGVITTVGMETLAWYRYEGCVDIQGIGIEMERKAIQMGATIKWPFNDSACLDADYFKLVADHLITEAGVRPILHCSAVDTMMDGKQVIGVITESKSGRQAILAKRVIDCTGDADIAYFAGAAYHKTPKEDRMGVSTIFSVVGIDKGKFMRYVAKNPASYADWSNDWHQETAGKENHLSSPYFDKEFKEAAAKGIIPKDKTFTGTWSTITDEGEATNLNLVYLKGYDGTSVEDLTAASIAGRAEAMIAIKALRAVVPGFEQAKLRNFSMTLGIRDTRKIVGRYHLTAQDVKSQAKFIDAIGTFPEFIDGYNTLILPTTGRYFEVPYGILLPEAIDNLLVAGRCVAGDKISHAAMRNMMACTVTGQGAGVAAAISIQRNQSTQQVDIKSVQSELLRQGVKLH